MTPNDSLHKKQMDLTIFIEEFLPGKWVADCPKLKGMMVMANEKEEASRLAQASCFHILGRMLQQRELQQNDVANVRFVIKDVYYRGDIGGS